MKNRSVFAFVLAIVGVLGAATSPATAEKTFWGQLHETAPRSAHFDLR